MVRMGCLKEQMRLQFLDLSLETPQIVGAIPESIDRWIRVLRRSDSSSPSTPSQ